MELKTLDDILKFQERFSEKLLSRLVSKASPEWNSAEQREAKRFLLDEAKTALKETQRHRDDTIKRLDRQLEQQAASIARIESEISEHKGVERSPKPKATPSKRGAARRKA